MANELAQLIGQNKQLQKEYCDWDRQIERIQLHQRKMMQQIDENKQKLMDLCDHNWQLNSPVYQERTRRTCTICQCTK